eukprot:m.39179 g.39179  ORF g.39179 m.39179 type:complete len:313 (+) comp14699_c0_seq1:172-1110(+)
MAVLSDIQNVWVRQIDNHLRCTICQDLFNIPMMLPSCSHNFCSECIRKHLAFKDQKHTFGSSCPQCSAPAKDTELVNNRPLEHLVIMFRKIRSAAQTIDPDGRLTTPDNDERRIPLTTTGISDHHGTSRAPTTKRKRLVNQFYKGYKTADLKKLLQSHKLSSKGPREKLIKRHKDFTLLYNAECDSLIPKSMEECARIIEEREQKAEQQSGCVDVLLQYTKYTPADEILAAQRTYLRRNRAVFIALTKQAKKTRKVRKSAKVSEKHAVLKTPSEKGVPSGAPTSHPNSDETSNNGVSAADRNSKRRRIDEGE